MNRTAGAVSIFTGIGFGVPAVVGTGYFIKNGQTWEFLGFPTYGDGPFEEFGVDTSVALLFAFVIVCISEIVLGVLLWRDARHVRVYSCALLPVELIFWIGFALPFGLLLGFGRVASHRLLFPRSSPDARSRQQLN